MQGETTIVYNHRENLALKGLISQTCFSCANQLSETAKVNSQIITKLQQAVKTGSEQ